jgi:hypothetical protein
VHNLIARVSGRAHAKGLGWTASVLTAQQCTQARV